MAGVAFLRLRAAAVCAFVGAALLLAGSASASWHAQVFVVGGEPRGWRKPTAPSEETYNHWAARNRFHVGDFLHFKYEKNDSVLVVSGDDYKFCGAAKPVLRFDGGDTRLRLDHAGSCYFISGALGHCDEGQRMALRVLLPQGQDGGPARAPAAATPPGGGDGEGGSYEDPGSGSNSNPGSGDGDGWRPPPHMVPAAGADGNKTASGAADGSVHASSFVGTTALAAALLVFLC